MKMVSHKEQPETNLIKECDKDSKRVRDQSESFKITSKKEHGN